MRKKLRTTFVRNEQQDSKTTVSYPNPASRLTSGREITAGQSGRGLGVGEAVRLIFALIYAAFLPKKMTF